MFRLYDQLEGLFERLDEQHEIDDHDFEHPSTWPPTMSSGNSRHPN